MDSEQRLEKLEREILGLRAQILTQACESAAMRDVLRTLDTALRPELPDLERQPSLDDAYVVLRKAFLQKLLLHIEDSDPALAAKLNAILQKPGLSFPLDWD